jgi:hypothetical protein
MPSFGTMKIGLLCLTLAVVPLADVVVRVPVLVDGGMDAYFEWLFTLAFLLAYVVPFAVLPLFLPDGRVPHWAWRFVAVAWFVAIFIEVVVGTVNSGDEVQSDWIVQYFEISAWIYFVGTWAVLFSLIHRLMLAPAGARARVGWFVLGTWVLVLSRC